QCTAARLLLEEGCNQCRVGRPDEAAQRERSDAEGETAGKGTDAEAGPEGAKDSRGLVKVLFHEDGKRDFDRPIKEVEREREDKGGRTGCGRRGSSVARFGCSHPKQGLAAPVHAPAPEGSPSWTGRLWQGPTRWMRLVHVR